MLCSNSVQEVHDIILITQVSILKSRIPFLYFFDGSGAEYVHNTIECPNSKNEEVGVIKVRLFKPFSMN